MEVVPNACVQYPLVCCLSDRWLVVSVRVEERVSGCVRSSFFELLLHHEDVDGEDDGRRGDLRSPVVQKLLVDQRERQDLQGHLVDLGVGVETEHPEVPIQELFGTIEVEVKAQQSQNLLLELHEVLLPALVAVQVFESVDHVHEVWMLWLL